MSAKKSDESFDEMLEKFQKAPGTAPPPPDVDQSKLEETHEKYSKTISELETLVSKIEKLVETDFEKCKLEYFNIDYLLFQLPKDYRPKKLLQRIDLLRKKINEQEKNETHKKLEKGYKDDLQKITEEYEPDEDKFFDLKKNTGMDTGKKNQEISIDEERFLQEIEKDENDKNQESKHFKKRSEPEKKQKMQVDEDKDLEMLQNLERQESEDAKKSNYADSINSVQESLKQAVSEKSVSTASQKNKGHVLKQNDQKKIIKAPDFSHRISSSELYDKGMEYFRKKSYSYAIDCFKKVLEIAPNNFAARIRIQQAQEEQSKNK